MQLQGFVMRKCSVEYENASMYRGVLLWECSVEHGNAAMQNFCLTFESNLAQLTNPALHNATVSLLEKKRSTGQLIKIILHLVFLAIQPRVIDILGREKGQPAKKCGQLPTKQMNAWTMLQLCLCLLVSDSGSDRQEINDRGAIEKGHRVNRSSLTVMNMSSCNLIL